LAAAGRGRFACYHPGVNDEHIKTIATIYAAVVATGALLLSLKTWLDSGVKLRLSLMADGMVTGGDPRHDEKDLVFLTVTNRGDAPTMITNMVLFEMTSWWQRWRIKPKKSYVIPNPQLRGYPSNVPSDLEPAKKWTGAIRKRGELIPDLHNGHFYTGVYASHRDRPYLVRIPKKRDPLPKGTEELD
jgi:hypothetical protein